MSRARQVPRSYPASRLSGAIPSRSQAVNQSVALCLVEIEIPGAVREHVAAGLKAKYPSTRLSAIYDVAVYVCQDSPGNVPVE